MNLSVIKSKIKGVLGLTKKTPLQPGDPAPELGALDEAGRRWTLADVKGQAFVLYFYPKDDTPGCTKESCGFRDALPGLGAVRMFGASQDPASSHGAFKQKYNLNFPLLVDTSGELSRRWGVDGGGSARRVTFLVDAGGVIRAVWDPVKVDGHAGLVSGALKAL